MAKMHFWVGWFPTEQEFLQYVGLGNDQSNDSSAELSSFAREVGADEFEPDFCIAKYLNESDDVVEFARFVPTSTENILEKCMSFGLKKANSLLCYNLRAGISDGQAEHAGLLNYLGIHPYSTRAIESRFSTSGMEFSTFVGTISQSVEEFMEYFNQDDYLNALEQYRQGKTKKRPNPNLRCQFCKDVGLDFYYPQLLRIAFSQELKLVDAESLVQEVLTEPIFYDVLPYHLKDANINMANCAFCYIANGFREKDKDQHISIYIRNSPTLIKRKKKDIDELDNYNELQFLGNLVWE